MISISFCKKPTCSERLSKGPVRDTPASLGKPSRSVKPHVESVEMPALPTVSMPVSAEKSATRIPGRSSLRTIAIRLANLRGLHLGLPVAQLLAQLLWMHVN